MKKEELEQSILDRSEALADALECMAESDSTSILEQLILLKACDEILQDLRTLDDEGPRP